MQGTFIAIEGGEGSGKSSVVAFLKAKLPHVHVTREPGGSPYAEEIRTIALHGEHAKDADGATQLLLHFAARRDHMEKVILPTLARGTHVLSDRFAASSWALNICGQAQREHVSLFHALHDHIVGVHSPHYIFLDVPVELGIRRRATAGAINHFDTRKIDFHTRVAMGYHEFFADKRHTRIDASKPLEEVSYEAFAEVERLLAIP